MVQKLLGYARLARPANLPTAAADILTGVAVVGIFSSSDKYVSMTVPGIDILSLVFASVFLYAGGVILNDVFDYRIDAVERPERPIPSGLIPLKWAAIYGIVVLLMGIVLAFLVNNWSGQLAIALAACIVLYDAVAKKYDFFGPLTMGICRGFNLMLGMSILGALGYWWMAAIPIVYIFAITLISRGEVHGDNKNHIVLAGVLYATVISAVLILAFLYTESIVFPILFLVLFSILVFRPLIKAHSENSPQNIKKAVMAGVLSLVVLDASIAVSFSTWWYGLLILALLPISKALSKLFAVT
ncbi:4-hydroxybenzoate polyprenyltransferase [Pricia antarctica]|uniref:4-hydroxybenzoate polyprenyltransferase n=1 Tax=Pricia antarctica TaxID=641691 RepID=A0A1G7FTM4_9FLAO|nr:UbiA-like protein EboC [Pricia antarctica]SDE79253.1 4-hydroxybenzoate polyprenyltransferase [Pricia antarctica]